MKKAVRIVPWAVVLAMLVGLIALSMPSTAAAPQVNRQQFFEYVSSTELVGEFIPLQGRYVCRIGGNFDSEFATVETLVTTRIGVRIVREPELVAVASETDWVAMEFGFGAYRLTVSGPGTGNVDIWWHCRWLGD